MPNPSFEDGWYNAGGVPELQVPNAWRLEWEAGANPLDPDPWNRWVRPESRVLSRDFLPPAERSLFIWQGNHTVKIFKGQGAISFRLLAEVALEPGVYELQVDIFPDLVVGYEPSGAKIFADDVLAGEVRLLADGGSSGWMLPEFGARNRFAHQFAVGEARVVTVGAALRGRWAILNNGWFMDSWGLYRISP